MYQPIERQGAVLVPKMNLKNYHVRGFKAIEDMSIEPKSINLVTGRNNSGKTSLLESINLCFNPNSISTFDVNASNLINIENELLELEAQYYDVPDQMTIEDFDENKESAEGRSVSIEPVDPDGVGEWFIDLFEYFSDTSRGTQSGPSGILEEFDSLDPDDIHESIENTLYETISERAEDIDIDQLQRNFLLVTVDDDTFRLASIDDRLSNHIRDIQEKTTERVLEDIQSESEYPESQIQDIHRFIHFSTRFLTRIRGSKSFYIGSSPEDVHGVSFIRNPQIRGREDVDLDRDNSGVMISDIEDHLQEYELVEDLDHFSFDHLVFEEDDEKYEIPYKFMGDGFKTVVGLLWEVLDPRKAGNALLIEEAEIHMHPGYVNNIVKKLVKLCYELDIQLFITTHNSDFIEAFFSDAIPAESQSFLRDEFALYQLTDPTYQVHDYDLAAEKLNELFVDLRGI